MTHMLDTYTSAGILNRSAITASMVLLLLGLL